MSHSQRHSCQSRLNCHIHHSHFSVTTVIIVTAVTTIQLSLLKTVTGVSNVTTISVVTSHTHHNCHCPFNCHWRQSQPSHLLFCLICTIQYTCHNLHIYNCYSYLNCHNHTTVTSVIVITSVVQLQTLGPTVLLEYIDPNLLR